MQDPKGGYLKESQHKVKTLSGAQSWFTGTIENDLPVTIYQWETSNGRHAYMVKNSEGELVYKRG
jgi:hypothetical protein